MFAKVTVGLVAVIVTVGAAPENVTGGLVAENVTVLMWSDVFGSPALPACALDAFSGLKNCMIDVVTAVPV